jgi:RNA polymerase sigma factor (sigma-70 family)
VAERQSSDGDAEGDAPESGAGSDPRPNVDDLCQGARKPSPEERLRFERAFAGILAAFEKIVRRRFAESNIPPASQEQLCGDVFETLFEMGSSRVALFNLRATIDGITFRVLSNYHRRLKRRPPRVEGYDLDALPAPVDVEERIHALVQASEALDKLSDREALVLQWVDVEGLEYDEVAARLGVSRGTVCSWLRAARRKFKEAAAPPSGGGDGT